MKSSLFGPWYCIYLCVCVAYSFPCRRVASFWRTPIVGQVPPSSSFVLRSPQWPPETTPLLDASIGHTICTSGNLLHSYGKIHHFQWLNPLFRLGHFPWLCHKLPEVNLGWRWWSSWPSLPESNSCYVIHPFLLEKKHVHPIGGRVACCEADFDREAWAKLLDMAAEFMHHSMVWGKKLQETHGFWPSNHRGFRVDFSHAPILWINTPRKKAWQP